MKKIFWFVVLFLLLLTFSGEPPLKPYRDQIIEYALSLVPAEWQSDSQAVASIQRDLNAYAQTLGLRQQEFLATAAANKDSILSFRQNYCVNKDFHPVLFGEPLQRSCSIIDKYYDRLTGN